MGTTCILLEQKDKRHPKHAYLLYPNTFKQNRNTLLFVSLHTMNIKLKGLIELHNRKCKSKAANCLEKKRNNLHSPTTYAK